MPSSSSSSSSRWCPTTEQLMILKELYRRGLTNPNASQIQKITADLSCFGKIQGKNVFYWFQNHKARDRQKLRKKFANQLHLLQLHQHQQLLSSSANLHHLFSCGSAQSLSPQGGGASEVTWRVADPSRDCRMRTYGRDLMMSADVGPIFHCCRKRTLETLELFPLTSPTRAKHQETTAD